MKELFFKGGPGFMGALTILLIITTAWFIYHFIISYNSKKINKEKLLCVFGYGKSIGLFALVTGVSGQMIGLYGMFSTIEHVLEKGEEVIPVLVFGAIKVTMICTFYGILIYLLSILLWFVATIIIEKKFK